MRCTRCDQWVAPQSVGRTPRGLLVFGWCRDCMDDQGCSRIEAPLFGADLLNGPSSVEYPSWMRTSSSDSAHDSHRLGVSGIRLIAALLGVWGAISVCLGSARLLFASTRTITASALGNGTAGFLIVGGLSLMSLAALFWILTLGRRQDSRLTPTSPRIHSTFSSDVPVSPLPTTGSRLEFYRKLSG